MTRLTYAVTRLYEFHGFISTKSGPQRGHEINYSLTNVLWYVSPFIRVHIPAEPSNDIRCNNPEHLAKGAGGMIPFGCSPGMLITGLLPGQDDSNLGLRPPLKSNRSAKTLWCMLPEEDIVCTSAIHSTVCTNPSK